MRYFILFILLFSISLFGLEKSELLKMKSLPDDTRPLANTSIYRPPSPPSNFVQVGALDTVGGTFYDWQFNGPCYHMIAYDPHYGAHVLWMYSPDAASGWPNRNMRYNFYDLSTRTWVFNQEPPYLNYGVNAFQLRTGFGGFHVLPSGEAVACAHGVPEGNTQLTPIAVKDVSPGSGLFPDVFNGPEAYQWPPISVTQNSWIHCAMIDAATQEIIHYAKVRDGQWTDPVVIGPGSSAEPLWNGGPAHNLVSSRNSNNLMVIWTQWDHPGGYIDSAGYRISSDGGENWSEITALPFPPAFTPGSESLASFWIPSLYGFFDRNEVPHFVASLWAYFIRNETLYVYDNVAEIWHYCPTNTPNWSRVARVEVETLYASWGYNAMLAGRPTIGENLRTGELVCVWEQFTPSNVEPTTQRLRGAIWGAASTDNGLTWLPPVLLTDTLSTVSFRFPSVSERFDDTVWITYMGDLQAGFFVQGEGQATENPIFVHKVPLSAFIGIAESKSEPPPTISCYPNPFSRRVRLSLTFPTNTADLKIYDASGKVVKKFSPVKNNLTWDGTDENGRTLPKGIYFLKLNTKDSFVTEKLILSR